MLQLFRTVSLTVLAGLLSISTFSGAALAGDHGKSNIVETASKTESLSTLVAAVKAADLVETLSGKGPFTVFAPTNDAFGALPAGTLDALLKPENKGTLTAILTYHVVPAKAVSSAVVKMINDGGGSAKVKTVQGEELTLKLQGERVTVTDAKGTVATVVQADLMQSNGVVHVIDKVLLPK